MGIRKSLRRSGVHPFHGERFMCNGINKISKKGNHIHKEGCGRIFIHEGECPACHLKTEKV